MQISTGVSLKLSQEENWRKGKRIKMFAWQNRITSLWRDHNKNDRSISVNLIYTPYRNTLNLLITLYHYFRNRRDIGFNRQRLLIRAHISIGLENNFKKDAFSLYHQYDHALKQEPLPRRPWNLHFWYTLPWLSLM